MIIIISSLKSYGTALTPK